MVLYFFYLDMLPYYENFLKENKEIKLNEDLKDTMKKNIEKKLKELNEKIEDTEKNAGENEVREALLAKAQFFKQIGDKVMKIINLGICITIIQNCF
jgi:26S proteasome regulatory subunit N7